MCAVAACVPRTTDRTPRENLPEDPAQPPLNWKTIAENGGIRYEKLRANSAQNLLVYASISAIELDARPLAEAGWDVLTLRAEQRDAKLPPEFFRFALDQPGYRRRVFAVSGSDLAAFMAAKPDALAGLVILRPGDAGFLDEAARTALATLPETLPVLALMGPDETGAGYYTLSFVKSRDKQIRFEPLATRSPDDAGLLSGRVLNFLHLLRYPSQFIESRRTFQKGCRLAATGAWVIAHVSGERADGFCPLLLKFGLETYRAVDVLEDGVCDYGITQTPVIRCL